MLSAGLAVEPAHRVGHGLGPSLGAGLGAGLGAALGAGLGPPSHHPMLQAFTGGEFLRPLPPHRPGEPGPGAAMFSPPELRYWLHHHQQQQQHLARYAASQSVGHHRQSPQSAPPLQPPPAPSPVPVNLTAHKEDKERLPPPGHAPSMGYHYPHYPMAAPMFPPAPYSPYASASRLPPPADAPATYSPPAGSPAPLPPPPPPKTAGSSRTFKVPVPAGPAPSSAKDGSMKHRMMPHKHPSASTSVATPLPTLPSATPMMMTTATPHLMSSASTTQDYHPQAQQQAPQTSPGTGAAANTLPQFWKGSLIRLASGELRRVQEIKAEDFVASAERNPTLKADPATVVRIQTLNSSRISIGLSVGGGSESEIETTSEHPFFVYGVGWASCSPDRSLQLLGLSCRQLQVRDVVVSLTHRQQPQQHLQQPPPPPQRPAPKSQAARRTNKKHQQQHHHHHHHHHHQQPNTSLLPPPTGLPRTQHHVGPASTPTAPAAAPSGDTSSSSSAGKKRRWSAPDQLAAAAAEEAAAAAAAAQAPKLARVPE